MFKKHLSLSPSRHINLCFNVLANAFGDRCFKNRANTASKQVVSVFMSVFFLTIFLLFRNYLSYLQGKIPDVM